MCTSFVYCRPVESCHLWQTRVVGFQSCWALGAWTAAAPWSDSVECGPTCYVSHSAQCPSSSPPFQITNDDLCRKSPCGEQKARQERLLRYSSCCTIVSTVTQMFSFHLPPTLEWIYMFIFTFFNSSNLPWLFTALQNITVYNGDLFVDLP